MVWRDEAWRTDSVIRLATTVASGLLLTVIAVLAETAEQPFADITLDAIWAFVVKAGVQLLAFGLCWSFFALAAERRLKPGNTVPAIALAAIAITVVGLLVNRIFSIETPRNILGGVAGTSHLLWINAFFGSLYVASFVSVRRVLRSRDLFVRVRLARDHSLAVSEEMRLESFRAQLQPKTILDAIQVIRELYRASPAQADRLVDDLADFLRLAMRGLKSEQTTLAGELELAGQYFQLKSKLSGDVGKISVDPAALPQTSFPAGLLMPLIEHLCLAGGRPSLSAGQVGDAYCVTLKAEATPSRTLPERLLRRVDMASKTAGIATTTALSRDGVQFNWCFRDSHYLAERHGHWYAMEN